MRRLMIPCLLLAMPVQAQETQGRLMLEAGLDGGNSVACPGQYVGIEGRVAGPVSAYVNVDNYRCSEFTGQSSRAGVSVRFGPSEWLLRPAARGGLVYSGGDVLNTLGASLTLGRRYGGRIIFDRQSPVDDADGLILFQVGGYISF